MIDQYTQEYIEIKERLRNIATNEYLLDSSNPNYLYVRERFFDNDDNKTQKLNIGSGIGSTICNLVSDYVGRPSEYLNIRKSVFDFESVGYGCYEYRKVKDKYEIGYVYADKHYNDGVDHVIRIYSDEQDFTKYYMFERTYYVGYTENKLYLMSGKDTLTNAVEAPLATINATRLYEPVEVTGLDIPAIVVVKEDQYEQYPQSDIEQIEQHIYALDRNIVMFNAQFLMNAESYLLLKNITLPQKLMEKGPYGNKIDMTTLGRVLQGRDDADIKFVSNKNELIQEAIKYEDNQIRRISAAVSIPTDFLGLDSAHGSIGQGSRSMLHGSFVKKIERIRNIFDPYLRETQEVLNKMNNEDDMDYIRPDVFAKTDNELIAELKIARETKLVSLKSAIMMYQGLDDDGAEMELEKIQEEGKQAMEEAILVSNSKTNATNKPFTTETKDNGSESTDDGEDGGDDV